MKQFNMKSKTFFAKAAMLLLVALFSLTGARAETLTVYDGTTTSQYVPAMASYMRRYMTRSQFIIPAASLADMEGCSITAVKFYTNSTTTQYTSPTVRVYLKEVSDRAFPSKDFVTNGTTQVYSGQFSISNGELSITFTNSFAYNGGNLLIGIENSGTGGSNNYNDAFYGQNAGYAALYNVGNSLPTTGYYEHFIPKTTFTYTGSYKPTEVTASHITANSATISWNSNASSYNLRYRELGFYEDFQNLDNWKVYTLGEYIDGYEGWFSYNGMASAYSYHNISSNSGEALDANNWLVSPEVELGGTLTFDVLTAPPYPDSYEVVFSTGYTVEAMTASTAITLRELAPATSGTVTIDLSRYAGQTGYIAIHHKYEDGYFLSIDNFSICKSDWVNKSGVPNPDTIDELSPATAYEVQVQAVYDGNVMSKWATATFRTGSETDVPNELAATNVMATKATLSWNGSQSNYNLRYRHEVEADPTAPATIILTAGDVWSDGSGYQMLLDADATAYGSAFNATGGTYTSTNYNAFEYTIPVGAECSANASVVVFNNSVSIQIPAGTYDWCITNPCSGDNLYIAAGGGNVGGRYDNYVFEAGKTYEFVPAMFGENDGVDVTITPPMSDWVVVESVTTPYEHNALIPGTYYQWQVQGNLTEGTTEWSEISSFTTQDATTIEIANKGNNTELINALNGMTYDVKLAGRTLFKDGDWNTICLPFDLVDPDLDDDLTFTGTPLEGAELRVLGTVGFEDGILSLDFVEEGKVASGTPYLVRWPAGGDDIYEPVFEDVQISKTMIVKESSFADDVTITFKGTYDYTKFEETDRTILFLGPNSNFYYPLAGASLGACRAYFELSNTTASTEPVSLPTKFRMTFSNNPDDETGIKNLNKADASAWYDLDGRKLAGKPVQKGIYINNGKKEIIK